MGFLEKIKGKLRGVFERNAENLEGGSTDVPLALSDLKAKPEDLNGKLILKENSEGGILFFRYADGQDEQNELVDKCFEAIQQNLINQNIRHGYDNMRFALGIKGPRSIFSVLNPNDPPIMTEEFFNIIASRFEEWSKREGIESVILDRQHIVIGGFSNRGEQLNYTPIPEPKRTF